MSENIPESIPTSMDKRSQRPVKKRALSPTSQQSVHITALFKNPERNINVLKAREKALPPPPEIVANVQGSSAGAGSGEFHVYKASRRREYERLKMMDEEVKKEQEQDEFERKAEEMRKKDEERTAKNRAKRNKKKNNNNNNNNNSNNSKGNQGDKQKNGMDENQQKVNGLSSDRNQGNVDVDGVAQSTNQTVSNGATTSSSNTSKGVVVFDDD